LKRIFTAPEP